MKTSVILTSIFLLFLCSCTSNNKKSKKKEPKYPIVEKRDLQQINDSLYSLTKFDIDSFVDKRDKHVYATMRIGNQIWCIDNIKYETKINPTRHFMGGNLYTYEAAEEACPKNFSIPTEEDWHELFCFIENEFIKKSSMDLIERLIEANKKKAKHQRNIRLPSINDYEKLDIFEKCIIVSIYLNSIGFSTDGQGRGHSGYSYFTHDGYSYFWTSTKYKKNIHKCIILKHLSSFDDPEFPFSLIKKDDGKLRLKCIKK